MAGTGITAVKNALVARIAAWWTPADPDLVTGAGRIDEDIAQSVGRKVYVFRSARVDETADRGEDQHDYVLVIWVLERFTDAGDPPEEWIDARVSWVESLFEFLGDARAERLLAAEGEPESGLWNQAADLTTVYDVEDLTELKAFSAVITVTYREQTEA